MQKAKDALPEIIEHVSPLTESSAMSVLMPKETRPLITIDINTEILLRGIRFLKEAMPVRLLKK